MKRIFHLLFLIIFLSTLNLLADTIVRPIKPIPIPHPLIVIDPLLTQPQYDFIALAEKDAMWLSLSKPTIDDMGEGLKFGPNTNASKGVVRYNNVVGSDGKPYHNALYVQPNITAKTGAVGADIVPTNYSITWLPGSYTYYDSWLTLSILMKILNNSGDKIINTMRNRARYYDWQNNLINETFNVYKTGFAPPGTIDISNNDP